MRKLTTGIILATSLTGIVSCTAHSVDGKEIPLADYQVTNNILTFKAESTGCTTNKNFAIQVKESNEAQATISVLQIKPDHCRRMPFFDTFSLPLDAKFMNRKIILTNPEAQDLPVKRF